MTARMMRLHRFATWYSNDATETGPHCSPYLLNIQRIFESGADCGRNTPERVNLRHKAVVTFNPLSDRMKDFISFLFWGKWRLLRLPMLGMATPVEFKRIREFEIERWRKWQNANVSYPLSNTGGLMMQLQERAHKKCQFVKERWDGEEWYAHYPNGIMQTWYNNGCEVPHLLYMIGGYHMRDWLEGSPSKNVKDI
jgi:hypothetical protein